MYVASKYPQFRDIKVKHFDGYNPENILADVLSFIGDNPSCRWIDSHVNYFFNPTIAMPQCSRPEKHVWVEVTLIYTE